jgi:hypothetical protein
MKNKHFLKNMIWAMLLHMKHLYALPFFVVSLMTATCVAAAEVKYYDIELIIFESSDPAARHSEMQKSNLNRELPEQAIELGKPYPGPIPEDYDPKLTFKPLPQKAYQLAQEEKLLKESKNYNVLLHTAWRQPGMEESIALPVHIHQEYIYRAPGSDQETPASAPTFGISQPASTPPTRSILDGYVRIVLSRYLHAQVDLSYVVGIKPQQDMIFSDDTMEPVGPEPMVFQLKQSRKMRSTEVHYLDHPVLGVIVLATPYEIDAKQINPGKK